MFGFFRNRKKEDFFRAMNESVPERQVEIDVITACRASFGPPPRSFTPREADSFRLTVSEDLREAFVESNDKLLQVLAAQDCLRDRGRVVWGHLVQANKLLFDPDNDHTCPADVIYSTDPFFEGRTALLSSMARGLFARKGSSGAERELQKFVDAITDEMIRVLRRELPRDYCGGRSVFFSTCLIQPRHLPNNHLASGAFPLVINPEETEAVMILPSGFWPPELLSLWRGSN